MKPERTRRGWSKRRARLLDQLSALDGLLVAFSGGVDSSVLLHAAHGVLGARAIGFIADSPSLPRSELDQARELAHHIGAELVVVCTHEGQDPRYRANVGDRCYFCKAALFEQMQLVARERALPWLAFGEITDDARDERPGVRAAREAAVLAPLVDADLDKADVRRYARQVGLPVAEKPASACLASRIPIGTEVRPELLAQVERAEAALHALGLRQLRVRHHGLRARVEVGADELAHARSLEQRLGVALAQVGFEGWELSAYRSPGS